MRFAVGDWIEYARTGGVYRIVNVVEGFYVVETFDGEGGLCQLGRLPMRISAPFADANCEPALPLDAAP